MTPTPSPTPVPSYYLWINDTPLGPGQPVLRLEEGPLVEMSPIPNANGGYEEGVEVTLYLKETGDLRGIEWRGVDRVIDQGGRVATVRIKDETFIDLYLSIQ